MTQHPWVAAGDDGIRWGVQLITPEAPGAARQLVETAKWVEGLGYDLLMVSDHIAVTPDVAEQYPAPFYEPFTTLSWLAGVTHRGDVKLWDVATRGLKIGLPDGAGNRNVVFSPDGRLLASPPTSTAT